MLENVVGIRVTSYGTIIEEVEIFCRMTGLKQRLLVEYTVGGFCRTMEVSAG